MKKRFIVSGPDFDSDGVDLIPNMNKKCTDYSPFITLCLWTIRMDHVISQSCYMYYRTILQGNCGKMTMKLSFSYNSVVKFNGKKIGSHDMTVLYPNPCYNKLRCNRDCTVHILCASYFSKMTSHILLFLCSPFKTKRTTQHCLTHALLNGNKSSLGNSVNPDQVASDKAI